MPVLAKESNQGLRQLLDGLQTHFRALEVLKLPVVKWDSIIIYLISTKLDNVSRREWELSNKTANLPSLVDYIDSLKNRCRLLESLEVNNKPYNRTSSSKPVTHTLKILNHF